MGAALKIEPQCKPVLRLIDDIQSNHRMTHLVTADTIIEVLLIEDDPWTAKSVKSSLNSCDGITFHVVHVNHVADAMVHLCEERFDVVLLDLSQPDALGAQGFLRMSAKSWDAPVIVFTRPSDSHEGARALMAGAQGHWVKGDTNHRSLLRSIRIAIGNKIRPVIKKMTLKAANDSCSTLSCMPV